MNTKGRPSILAARASHRRHRGSGGGDGVATTFGAEWRTGTGKTEAVIRDTSNAFGGWQAYNGTLGNNAAEIMAADISLAGRGNYFRVFNDGTNNMTVREDQALPNAQQTHWGRVYFRNNKNVGSHNHPIALGGLGGGFIVNVPLLVTGQTGATLIQCQTLRIVGGGASGYRRTRWTPGVQGVSGQSTLAQNTWYLCEWGLTWGIGGNPDRYNMEVWIHGVDANGVIDEENLYTSATYFWEDYFGVANGNLASTQAADSTIYGYDPGDQTRQYVFGNEGPASGSTNGEHFDMASFGISTEGRLRDQALAV